VKVLFICKKRELSYSEGTYSDWGDGIYSSGLLVSAQLISDMLNGMGVHSKVVQVIDNNDVDREVYRYKPTHVIIEALWIVPEKFHILKKLHPKVKWIVRLHSELPFIATEGMAMKWIFDYKRYDHVAIAVNSKRMEESLKGLLKTDVLYLPNFYPVDLTTHPFRRRRHHKILDVGCFGAIRPLKNQLIQAVAAIRYADENDRLLKFHINSKRVENGAEILKNIRALFDNVKHELVEHPWIEHDEFIKYIRKTLDVGMNVSYSETYSVITADMVANDIPIVVSREISWAHNLSKADPNDLNDIVLKIDNALNTDKLAWTNKHLLEMNSSMARHIWKNWIEFK
jgi:hypothetical protein